MTAEIENVLLVVVDALRVDRVDAYEDTGLTPNLDLLASEGEAFEQCYSCINATDPSLTTILTGQYPTRSGVLNHGDRVTQKERQRVASTTSLAELVNDTHETFAIDVLERWHQRGFSEYYSATAADSGQSSKRARIRGHLAELLQELPDNIEQIIRSLYFQILGGKRSSQIDGKTVTDVTLNAIEKTDEPWFALAHYWDTHIPYSTDGTYPEVVLERSYDDGDVPIGDLLDQIEGSAWERQLRSDLLGDAETIGDVKRQYDAAVCRVDQEIGQIVKHLEEIEELEKTAIIVTADHGESMTEHGILFDHHGLYDASIHVPLIVYAPGFNGRETEFVQHFDLAPTVLDMLGKEHDEERFDGVSLFSTDDGNRQIDRDAIFAEEAHTARRRTIRTDSYKYITRIDGGGTCRYCDTKHTSAEELYDVMDDTSETENIVEDQPEIAAELANRLSSWIDELPDPREEEVDFGKSEEVMQRLEDMGYV